MIKKIVENGMVDDQDWDIGFADARARIPKRYNASHAYLAGYEQGQSAGYYDESRKLRGRKIREEYHDGEKIYNGFNAKLVKCIDIITKIVNILESYGIGILKIEEQGISIFNDLSSQYISVIMYLNNYLDVIDDDETRKAIYQKLNFIGDFSYNLDNGEIYVRV